MKPGDLYNRCGKIYIILDLFERSWSITSDDRLEKTMGSVQHITCMGPDGFEEFPLDWFCRSAEVVND